MKLLLIYPPFCTPTIMPYSISYLKAFIEKNSNIEVKCLDLNAKFHKLKFKEFYKDCNYTEFHNASKKVYSENNRAVLKNIKPEFFEELLKEINKESTDEIAFSLVYNSQNFYTKALIDSLKQKCITGGPGVSSKTKAISNFISNEIELLNHFNIEAKHFNAQPNFEDYKESDYLTKEIIYPIKASSTCYYKGCAFCTHHNNIPYAELPLPNLKENSNYFFIDDMISLPNLLKIAKQMKNSRWWAQLRPTKELIPHLKELSKAGLKSVAWGVESGSQDILNKMNKGTKVKDVAEVLKAAKEAGVINTVYIMFGFPTETEEQFLETIDFLKNNSENIDLVSTSLFGLQKGSPVYKNPKHYKIKEIIETKRTLLDEKISFTTDEGLTPEQLSKLRKKYASTINKINKLPRILNYVKEQTLLN